MSRTSGQFCRLTSNGERLAFNLPTNMSRALAAAKGHLFEPVLLEDGILFRHIGLPEEEAVPTDLPAWVGNGEQTPALHHRAKRKTPEPTEEVATDE